ncbi:hypothetical protein MERGE_000546 [Pneumocystis wakefieldiae]|uniref:Rab GDP dissociation inhibitor n=1 Tax=Pneumocystis wakefieldiae TaxID=38082 RepID=A0A899FWK3_9ASCO|nr:hypothetical protein MERGE_000546 [Pneumocystis wakefieldiae]
MNETYDYIILGTGLKECILSGLLSVENKKVLHLDRNNYYGGETASLSLSQIYNKFYPTQEPPSYLGNDRSWSIDLIPKFIIANGELTHMLYHTDVTRYLEFKSISGSFVYKDKRIAKVPATDMEAIRCPLMNLFEKRRLKRFLEFICNYDEKDTTTHQSLNFNHDSMDKVYSKFNLETGTKEFIGHAMALYLDDRSPYIYPLFGQGDLPQSFARLSAVYGGTYMLNRKVDEILYENGVAIGIKSQGETAYASKIIGDPSYFPDKVQKTGRVVRVICILNHPIPNTDSSDSLQIIIPQSQVQRKHDIYIAMVSSVHNVCPKEVEPAFLTYIRFIYVTDILEPISKTTEDVNRIYREAEGKDLILKLKEET